MGDVKVSHPLTKIMQINQTPDIEKRLKNLFQTGKLVQVHVSKWSMTTSVSLEDLGLDKPATTEAKKPDIPGFITLGRKALFTDDVRLVFSRLESNARAYLLNNSHRFPICDAHFVPQKTLVKVLSDLEDFRKKYMKEVDTFITNYETYKDKMLTAYPDYRERLLPYYLTPEQARGKFDFTISFYETAFPRKLKKLTMDDLIAQNIAVESATAKYEELMKGQYQVQLKQMQDFLKESALGMRAEIVKTFEVIAAKIQNHEVVSGSNLKTLKATIDSFDALDFLDDAKVKENLKLVRKLVDGGSDFKNDEVALARLNTAINTTLNTAKSITDIDALTGEYTRKLDTDDEL